MVKEVIENKILKKFEATDVEIIMMDGHPLFELDSVGSALGYSRIVSVKGNPYTQIRRDRIKKVLKNAEIAGLAHGVTTYLTETELYDFMLEAHTEKCKSFRKWLVNEVLPTINKTSGYVEINHEDEFVDYYLGKLGEETKIEVIKELQQSRVGNPP